MPLFFSKDSHNGWLLVAELGESNTPTRKYVWGLDLWAQRAEARWRIKLLAFWACVFRELRSR